MQTVEAEATSEKAEQLGRLMEQELEAAAVATHPLSRQHHRLRAIDCAVQLITESVASLPSPRRPTGRQKGKVRG